MHEIELVDLRLLRTRNTTSLEGRTRIFLLVIIRVAVKVIIETIEGISDKAEHVAGTR